MHVRQEAESGQDSDALIYQMGSDLSSCASVVAIITVVLLLWPEFQTLQFWDNYKDYTYVGTLDGSYQHTLIATGTMLRPVQATFLGHIVSTKPAKNIGV